MRTLYSPGQTLPDQGDRVVRRYAMDGDTYLTTTAIGDRADVLWSKASAIGKTDWLGQIVLRLRLAALEPGEQTAPVAESAMILAAAGVEWADICHMKS